MKSVMINIEIAKGLYIKSSVILQSISSDFSLFPKIQLKPLVLETFLFPPSQEVSATSC